MSHTTGESEVEDRTTGIEITVMTPENVPFAIEMTDNEQWGNLPDDFHRLIAFEPDGCFVARIDEQNVGMISSTTYDDYAFLGSLIVRSEHRGRGIGETLMRHAIDHLLDKGIKTIELDGVFAAAPLYRRLGFRDKYLSLRLNRSAHDSESEQIIATPPLPSQIDATPSEIVAYDRNRTGLNREKILSRLLDEFSDRIYTVGTSTISGYAVLRPVSDNRFAIGPVVADDASAAELLIGLAVTDHGAHGLGIGLPVSAAGFTDVLLRLGFLYSPPSLRMYFGPRREYESHCFGILSPEKG